MYQQPTPSGAPVPPTVRVKRHRYDDEDGAACDGDGDADDATPVFTSGAASTTFFQAAVPQGAFPEEANAFANKNRRCEATTANGGFVPEAFAAATQPSSPVPPTPSTAAFSQDGVLFMHKSVHALGAFTVVPVRLAPPATSPLCDATNGRFGTTADAMNAAANSGETATATVLCVGAAGIPSQSDRERFLTGEHAINVGGCTEAAVAVRLDGQPVFFGAVPQRLISEMQANKLVSRQMKAALDMEVRSGMIPQGTQSAMSVAAALPCLPGGRPGVIALGTYGRYFVRFEDGTTAFGGNFTAGPVAGVVPQQTTFAGAGFPSQDPAAMFASPHGSPVIPAATNPPFDALCQQLAGELHAARAAVAHSGQPLASTDITTFVATSPDFFWDAQGRTFGRTIRDETAPFVVDAVSFGAAPNAYLLRAASGRWLHSEVPTLPRGLPQLLAGASPCVRSFEAAIRQMCATPAPSATPSLQVSPVQQGEMVFGAPQPSAAAAQPDCHLVIAAALHATNAQSFAAVVARPVMAPAAGGGSTMTHFEFTTVSSWVGPEITNALFAAAQAMSQRRLTRLPHVSLGIGHDDAFHCVVREHC